MPHAHITSLLAPWIAFGLLGSAVLAWLGLVGYYWSDYDTEAAPAFAVLVRGDVGSFLQHCPPTADR